MLLTKCQQRKKKCICFSCRHPSLKKQTKNPHQLHFYSCQEIISANVRLHRAFRSSVKHQVMHSNILVKCTSLTLQCLTTMKYWITPNLAMRSNIHKSSHHSFMKRKSVKQFTRQWPFLLACLRDTMHVLHTTDDRGQVNLLRWKHWWIS